MATGNMVSPPAPEVTTAEAADAVAQGMTLVDVREPHEFEAGHVPQAQLVPLGEVLERHEELDRHRKVYVICAVGGRSMAAAGALRQVGLDAVSVAGGTSQWIAEGRPVATGPSDK